MGTTLFSSLAGNADTDPVALFEKEEVGEQVKNIEEGLVFLDVPAIEEMATGLNVVGGIEETTELVNAISVVE